MNNMTLKELCREEAGNGVRQILMTFRSGSYCVNGEPTTVKVSTISGQSERTSTDAFLEKALLTQLPMHWNEIGTSILGSQGRMEVNTKTYKVSIIIERNYTSVKTSEIRYVLRQATSPRLHAFREGYIDI